jgi:hypothetical protein
MNLRNKCRLTPTVFHSARFHEDTNGDFQGTNAELYLPYFFQHTVNPMFQISINKIQISKCRPCNVQIMILPCQKFLPCTVPLTVYQHAGKTVSSWICKFRSMYKVGQWIMDYFLWARCRRHWELWAERLAKTDGHCPKLQHKNSSGNGRTRCCHGVRLPPRHHSELCAECENIKIFEGLSNSKNMVFNVKELLNVGLGLTLWRNGRKNRCERNERQI